MSLTYDVLRHKQPIITYKVALYARLARFEGEKRAEIGPQGLTDSAQIGSKVRFSSKTRKTAKSAKKCENGTFGGRPYRPLFT